MHLAAFKQNSRRFQLWNNKMMLLLLPFMVRKEWWGFCNFSAKMKSMFASLWVALLFTGLCHGWGGLFNRFSPELLSNLGYGGFSSYKLQPLINVSSLQVFQFSYCFTVRLCFVVYYSCQKLFSSWFTICCFGYAKYRGKLHVSLK